MPNPPFRISHWCSTKVKLTGERGGFFTFAMDASEESDRSQALQSRASLEYPQPYISTRVGPARFNVGGRTLGHTTSYGSVIKEKIQTGMLNGTPTPLYIRRASFCLESRPGYRRP
ncbi:hypothetical protein BDW75DRAFT_244052 [Aspergillus navahoensis]